MGKKSGPAAPDYTAAAEKQGESALALNQMQTQANRPNIETPWGSQTWTQNGDQWSTKITLSPQEQAALDSQMAIQQGRSGAAQTLLGQATQSFQTPMSWDNIPQRSGSVQAPNMGPGASLDPNVANASFDQGRSLSGPFGFSGRIQSRVGGDSSQYRDAAQEAVWQLQQPEFTQRRDQTETQLANQGLARGSEAWNREMQRLTDAESRARLMAISEGRNEANQMFSQDLAAGQFANSAQAQRFGQGLSTVNQANQIAGQEFAQNQSRAQFENNAQQQQFNNLLTAARYGDERAAQELQLAIQAGQFNNANRQSAISEETLRRAQPLNELNALLTGQQVNMPNMPGFTNAAAAAPVDYMGAAQNQYGASLDKYNANMGMLNNVANLGLSAFMFSDERLKENIRATGDSIGGVPVVEFQYVGLPGTHIGVIAQDVLRVKPKAVVLDPSGYYKVNYSELRA